MRLIDADSLKESILEIVEKQNGRGIDLIPVEELMIFIDKYQTAYDVDKVVEQIERYPLGNLGCQELNEIIDIVKGGGVNE